MPRPCWRPAVMPRAGSWPSTWRRWGAPPAARLRQGGPGGRPRQRVKRGLFGALAGSGALPFPRTAFEAAIRRGQVGVNSSLAAFGAGFEAAGSDAMPALLGDDAARNLAGETGAIVAAGIERLQDYQDDNYARDFLAQLERFKEIERSHGDGSGRLLEET